MIRVSARLPWRFPLVVFTQVAADKTFFDAIETTKAPMIASHSSSRVIAHHARNMTDDMMRALARNGASEKKNGNVLGA